jgi:hypothetical protein
MLRLLRHLFVLLDMKHDFVASYTIALPSGWVRRSPAQLIQDWSVSGTTRFASGFPATLYDNSDNSLFGTLGNSANNYLLDTRSLLLARFRSTPTGKPQDRF